MDNPQLVDYIRSHIAAGHTEAAIREHLLQHGWPADKVDTSFDHYNRSHVQSRPEPSAKQVSATLRPARNKPKRVTAAVFIILLAAVGLILYLKMYHHTKPVAVTPAQHLTFQQRQSDDIITVGGAVGQYVAANNNTLPTRVSIGADASSVVLCGNTCDPTTWQVSALSVYKPANVKIVPYTPSLTVPNQETMYLVAGARCKDDKLTSQGITPLSMSIAYVIQTDKGLAQRCIIL